MAFGVIQSILFLSYKKPAAEPPLSSSSMQSLVPVHRCIRPTVSGEPDWFYLKLKGRASMKRLFLLCIRTLAVATIFSVASIAYAQVANNTSLVGAVVDPSGAP